MGTNDLMTLIWCHIDAVYIALVTANTFLSRRKRFKKTSYFAKTPIEHIFLTFICIPKESRLHVH